MRYRRISRSRDQRVPLVASDAQRPPGITLDPTSRAKIDVVLGRVARTDPRSTPMSS